MNATTKSNSTGRIGGASLQAKKKNATTAKKYREIAEYLELEVLLWESDPWKRGRTKYQIARYLDEAIRLEGKAR